MVIKGTFRLFKPKIGKISLWSSVFAYDSGRSSRRVLLNEELLKLTPAVNGPLFNSAWNLSVMEHNHQNISFVLVCAWHGTIDSGLFTKWRKLRYSKTRIAYYSNSMATQALLLSGDVEKNPGPSQGKAASTNNKLSRSKPTAARCDHCQKTIRWNQKNISCANCVGYYHLKCVYLKSMVNSWLCNRCTWSALPFYKCRMLRCSTRPVFRILILTQIISQ